MRRLLLSDVCTGLSFRIKLSPLFVPSHWGKVDFGEIGREFGGCSPPRIWEFRITLCEGDNPARDFHPRGLQSACLGSMPSHDDAAPLLQGYNVLHPMGWDAFGLPAEQYAIKTGQHPRVTTETNVANFKRQLRTLGLHTCTSALTRTRVATMAMEGTEILDSPIICPFRQCCTPKAKTADTRIGSGVKWRLRTHVNI